jgi:TRAP-type mannitol/chloroaromatic compound transport system substrate-binding protein
MALAAAIQGARRPSQTITWTDENGTALDLSGATITARIRNTTSNVAAASDGAFTVVTAASGIFRWDYSAADVATAGDFEVQFTATYGSAPTPARTIVAPWSVLRAI